MFVRLAVAVVLVLLGAVVASAQTVRLSVNLDSYLTVIPKPYYLLAVQADRDPQSERLIVSTNATTQEQTFYVVDLNAPCGIVVGPPWQLLRQPGAWFTFPQLELVDGLHMFTLLHIGLTFSLQAGMSYRYETVSLDVPACRPPSR